MADSFRDQALRPLPTEIYKEALRLGASARLDAGDYAWVLMAAAAMITHSPVLRTAARPRLVSWSQIVVTTLVLTGALGLAGWVGAHGWTGYLAAEIQELETRRAEVERVTPPSWATRWSAKTDGEVKALFAAKKEPEEIVVFSCFVGTMSGACITTND